MDDELNDPNIGQHCAVGIAPKKKTLPGRFGATMARIAAGNVKLKRAYEAANAADEIGRAHV